MRGHYRFRLEGKLRTTCPSCGARKKFSPYVDTLTGEAVDAAECGKCSRLVNCAYHLPPREYFASHGGDSRLPVGARCLLRATFREMPREPYDARGAFEATCSRALEGNSLYRFFTRLFRDSARAFIPERVFRLYGVGTSRLWGGSPIFWLLDSDGTPRDGKIMGYDPANGKRVKEPWPRISWTSSRQSAARAKDYAPIERPIFGSQLVGLFDSQTLVVVESEKTALLMAAMVVARGESFGRVLPLALGGLSSLTDYKRGQLRRWLSQGRRIVFMPDRGCLDRWESMAAEVRRSPDDPVEVSDLVERLEGCAPGEDLGDAIVLHLLHNA